MIYGYYFKRIKKQRVADVCPQCGAENSMEVAVGCRTFHIMFIPFAAGKKRISQRCTSCKTEYVLFDHHQEDAMRMMNETRRPWYLWFLLLSIGVSVLTSITASIIASFKG